jgi:DNA-binding transcriptional ArsR family regulator
MAAASRLDAMFIALADPTRRAIVERLLAKGEMSVGGVAAPFRISAPAISRHLRVLEDAGMIERRVDKQWRYVRARPDALTALENWLTRQRRHGHAARDRRQGVLAARTPSRRKS